MHPTTVVSKVFVMAVTIGTLICTPAFADHTPDPSFVTIVGSLQDELGCPVDWQPDCALTHLTLDPFDQVWRGLFTIPAGSFEYKAALKDTWDESYPASNLPLDLGTETDVKFYYSHTTHWITDNQRSAIANLPGSFQDELGCFGDWDPGCLRTWLQDPDGDGTYSFTTASILVGDWEVKVAHDESWDENYGAGGVPGGPNIPFTVVNAGLDVVFTYDSGTHLLSISGPGLPVELLTFTVE